MKKTKSKINKIAKTNLEFIPVFLEQVLQKRLQSYFGTNENSFNFSTTKPPEYLDDSTAFGNFLQTHQPTITEYLALALAIIPHLQPGFLSSLITNALSHSGDFSELGGIKGPDNRGFLPTGETVLFIIAETDLNKRQKAMAIFDPQHWLSKLGILRLASVKSGVPKTQGQLMIDAEYIELFTTNKINPPVMSMDFPAQLLQTEQTWEDLVLPQATVDQLEEIRIWIDHHDTLLEDWGMSKKIKPGFRALFHGPPGTGKTLTATLLGKKTGKEVFRIDLSTVVSKFIGETEKNLATLFNKAQNKNWILFFDEADALFGKRTSVRDAHDKYANQEVSYLLQRIEEFSGLVILASNFKTNIDEAFTRRFQSIIYFPMPKANERLQIWQNSFPKAVKLHQKIDLNNIAQQYELTGANIMNVVQYTCLMALSREENVILPQDLLNGIRKELIKEGKIN